MKWFGVALLLVASAIADELSLAEECDIEKCKLPDCRCSGTDIPGNLDPRDVPQFVTVTFDGGVNVNNIVTYREDLYNRVNTDGCRAGATFYVSHEWTNYQLVNELYNNGFEIALNSITHQTPPSYWAEATYDTIKKEIAEQRILMSHFGNIPGDVIQGVRLPFLQLNGNTSFQVMADYDLLYDCTWATTTYNNPPLWPYTLDYASIQDCPVPPCPTASIPGPWVLPMVTWLDLENVPCSMVDACFNFPDREDEDAWYKFILTNFERHYLNNRAPFPFYIHESYFSSYPAVRQAYVRFLNLINKLPDVFMVNSAQVVEWVKNPIPIDEYKKKPCPSTIPTSCNAVVCILESPHNIWSSYYMTSCAPCPLAYPWFDNPLGDKYNN